MVRNKMPAILGIKAAISNAKSTSYRSKKMDEKRRIYRIIETLRSELSELELIQEKYIKLNTKRKV